MQIRHGSILGRSSPQRSCHWYTLWPFIKSKASWAYAQITLSLCGQPFRTRAHSGCVTHESPLDKPRDEYCCTFFSTATVPCEAKLCCNCHWDKRLIASRGESFCRVQLLPCGGRFSRLRWSHRTQSVTVFGEGAGLLHLPLELQVQWILWRTKVLSSVF